jgi:hypothetical protein
MAKKKYPVEFIQHLFRNGYTKEVIHRLYKNYKKQLKEKHAKEQPQRTGALVKPCQSSVSGSAVEACTWVGE